MLLSVIIPVYNVEKYIRRCIISAVDNQIDGQQYEVIVVDDDSPDNSVDVIQELMQTYSNIRLIRQNNTGLSGARNTALNNARGRYVIFLDGDDYLKQGAVNTVVRIADGNDLDILEFGAIGITEEDKEVYKCSISSSRVLSGIEYLDNYHYMNSACNKLYSLDFLDRHELRFTDDIYIEDFEFNTRAFFYAQKVLAVPNIVGCFVQTRNSITRNTNKAKHSRMINDIYRVIVLLRTFRLDQGLVSEMEDRVFKDRLGFLTFTLIWGLVKFNIEKEESFNLLDELKRERLYPINTPLVSKRKNLVKHVINIEIFLRFLLQRSLIKQI